jgi:hypothetical protein
MTLLLVASLFSAVAPPAPATAPAAAPAPAAARTGSDPNQMICRRYRESGTRLVVRRSCMTRQEWAAFNRLLRQDVDRAQLTRVIGAK